MALRGGECKRARRPRAQHLRRLRTARRRPDEALCRSIAALTTHGDGKAAVASSAAGSVDGSRQGAGPGGNDARANQTWARDAERDRRLLRGVGDARPPNELLRGNGGVPDQGADGGRAVGDGGLGCCWQHGKTFAALASGARASGPASRCWSSSTISDAWPEAKPLLQLLATRRWTRRRKRR